MMMIIINIIIMIHITLLYKTVFPQSFQSS